MVVEFLSPGMQYFNATNLGSQISFIRSQTAEGIVGTGEQQSVEVFLVRQEKRMQLCRHGEHDVKIGNVEQIVALVFDPAFFQEGLAFWAVPVAARIVRGVPVSAMRTAIHMPA